MGIMIIAVFVIGYLAIAFEHTLKINKAATALLTGSLCWAVYIIMADNSELVIESIAHHMGELSQILFFFTGCHDYCGTDRCARRV